MRIEYEPLLGQRDRRHHQALPRQLAESFMGERQTAPGARHADPAMAERGAPFLVHVLGGGGRRCFTIIKTRGLSLGRITQHKPPAADVARRWMRDSKSEGGSHGSIDRVAAVL